MSSIEPSSAENMHRAVQCTPDFSGDRDGDAASHTSETRNLHNREIKNDRIVENSHGDRIDDSCHHYGGAG
jgi:hypothetical protein